MVIFMPEMSQSSQSVEPTPHEPYVPDHVVLPEFTWPAVLVGAVLGIIFGASSLYLVLKVGITVSASIPVAVLSITLFRLFSRVFGVRQARFWKTTSSRRPARRASRSPSAWASPCRR